MVWGIMKLSNIFNHWKTIRTHRKWVRKYCFMAGIPWRGLTHDLSKYNPIEFLESARYWTGTSSPIEETKKAQGYSRAWLHHRGHNTHHWAYWADNFSEGLIVYPMPCKDFVEMVCDFLAAGHAYNKERFSYSRENKWWLANRDTTCKAMHENNKRMLDIIFSDLEIAEDPSIAGLKRDMVEIPERLIRNGYIQQVYWANIGRIDNVK